MEDKEKNPTTPALSSKSHQSPSRLQELVDLTKEGIINRAAPANQPHVKNIFQQFQSFLEQDEIVENKSFAALYKLLRYGLEFNENRVAQENKTLQDCLDASEKYTVKALRELVTQQMEHASPGEADVMKIVAEFNEQMLVEFNERFSTKKERLFASTVNFVSESGFSKILESIYYASPEHTKEIAYMFLRKVFKNTYQVVQKMDKKLIIYPCVFKEPLLPADQEDEQTPPRNQEGTAYLCYDFDIGNLYSYLDILSNVLRKMLNQSYIRERYQSYLQEKKKNDEEGYISYPLLLSLILRDESKEEVLNNMIVMGQGKKDEIKVVLLEFIKTLQTSEFLYLYSLKRYLYLKHFVLELLHDKQLAQIPQFFAGMVIAVGLLSNEQFKVSYELIERLMDEKRCFLEETKIQLAESLSQLTPQTLDDLLRFLIKGSYLLAGSQSKKILEEKFEEAKVLSAVQDPLSAIMQGLTEIGMEEAQTMAEQEKQIVDSPESQEEQYTILDSEELEKNFTIWQNLIRQIFQWQIQKIPAPLKWIEKTSSELDSHQDRFFSKEESTETIARLEGLQLATLEEDFTFFKDKAPKWQEKLQLIEKYYRRRGVCLGMDQNFKEVLQDLLEALIKHDAVLQKTHSLKTEGTFMEWDLVVKLPQDGRYPLPARQKKGNVQLFLGIGLIPMKKPHGSIETQPCLFLFQEIPSGFHSKGLHPFEVRVADPQTGNAKLHELLEIPLSESYYMPTLLALLNVMEKWLPLPAWEKETTQKVIGAIHDLQRLVNSKDRYGAVGGEVISNPNKPETVPKKTTH